MLFGPSQSLDLIGSEPDDAGVASAAANATLNIGGSIGLAIFTVIYATIFDSSLANGSSQLIAFTDGYKTTFVAAGIAMIVAAVVACFLIHGSNEQSMPSWGDEDASEAAHSH